MYVGLISDTHGIFSPGFKEFLEPVDCIWHAGDWGGDENFHLQISSFKPVVGVYGNCDGQPVRGLYPAHTFFECGGMGVLMTHIGGSPGHYDLRAQALIENYRPQIFVCGHSHILKVAPDRKYDMLYINPGAAGLLGWQTVRTALRFRIEDSEVKDMEVFELKKC
ncbi:MAG: metallophosphatase family protein [Bacteroidales bacterium]|nr:metallophosphatase family protein [Bacteroidales bacterium]